MEATDIYKLQESPNVTFADPVSETPYSDIFSVASRPILAGNMMDESSAREEAIDARIARIKSTGGEELQNPERGGYAHDAARIVNQRVQAGEVSYLDRGAETSRLARQMYEAKEAELAAKHGLQFGDIGEDAQKRLKEAQGQLGRAMDQPVNPILKYATEFAGGLLAQRRDPLFLGSLFFGPASATGKAAIARMASSALNQGLFNAGLSAMEQPAVQAWRNKTGQESGVVPALEDIGLAFAMGAIPGAAFQGAKEIVAPLRRLMSGRAERGDFAAVKEALGPVSELDAAGMKAGEESVAATEALTPEKPADVPPELHDDLASAALRRADDPEAPSPEAVAALHEPTQREKFRVEWDEEKSQFNAMTDAGEHIGYLTDAFLKGGKEAAFTAYVHVNEEWRRKGVASALYDEFSKRHEGNIKPSGVISDEALEFWLKRDPNKVRQAINEDVANVVKEIKAGNLPEDYSPVQSYEDPRVAKMAQEAFDVAMGGKPSIGTPVGLLKAATDRASFNSIRADIAKMSKDEVNAIQHEYIGGREAWPTKREALTAIENHFRAREFEATKMVQVGKANEAMFGPRQELRDRIEAAAPANPREAMQAADEALDDFGRRDGAAQMHETLARARMVAKDAKAILPIVEIARRNGIDLNSQLPMKEKHPYYDPNTKSVHLPNVTDAEFEKAYGMTKAAVISHEVAHGVLINWGFDKKAIMNAMHYDLRDELTKISKEFRPSIWKMAGNHASMSWELMTDGLAVWMTNPEARAQMPLLKKMLGDKLGSVNGPEKLDRNDPLGKVPRGAGTGDREAIAADLVRSCK